MLLCRFVITEFFRKPDEDWGVKKIWFHKGTNKYKRKIDSYYKYTEDIFFDDEEKIHRDFGQPAIITSTGREEYWIHGKCHRGHFEPAVIYPDGSKEYWVHGEKRSETNEQRTFRHNGY
jgi:hypothetical protein